MKEKVLKLKGNLKSTIKNYLIMTKPINKLSFREIDVLSLLIYYFFIEKENFKNENDLWEKVFHKDTKMDIKIELDMEDHTLQNILSTLRKKGVITGRKINKIYMPDIFDGNKVFKISYIFEIKD